MNALKIDLFKRSWNTALNIEDTSLAYNSFIHTFLYKIYKHCLPKYSQIYKQNTLVYWINFVDIVNLK